jgi:hypothetical protein
MLGMIMSKELKCPKCGEPLESGFIQAPRGVFWDNQKHHLEVLISEELFGYLSITMPNKEAFRCKKCKLVLFGY